MKIAKVETIVLKKKVENPVSDSLHTLDVGGALVTRIYTDDGIVGTGINTFGRIESGMATVKFIIDRELAPLLIGRDPNFTREIRHDMFFATEYYGTIGVANFAIAAIDCAIWDIKGKAANLPVAHLLGARRKAIPAYAMVGWYYKGGENEFVQQCIDCAEEGFKAVKLKVGKGSLQHDIERIKTIRKELGQEFIIMVDANCIFDEAEALRRGLAYQEYDIYWYEEPIQPYMRDAHTRLSQKLTIPLAIGENYFTRHQFYDVMKAGCLSIVQPDSRRAGGVTEWMDIGTISEVMGFKLASHGGGPGNVNVLCAIENAIYLETGSLKHEGGEDSFFTTRLKLVDGAVPIPDVPGMGNDVNEDYIKKYRID